MVSKQFRDFSREREVIFVKHTTAVIVGNSSIETELLKTFLLEAFPASCTVTIHCFLSPLEAYSFLCSNECQLLFTGVDLRGMDGIALCKKVREIRPHTAIVLTTPYDEHVLQALQSYIPVAGYLSMPTSQAAVRELIAHHFA